MTALSKEYFDQKLDGLEKRINARLEAIYKMLDVRHRVSKLEEQVMELRLKVKG